MNSFFRELKQRNVYRVAVGYAVVAWLVIQISATVMPAYHAPDWILPLFITAVALGFPVALVLAWAFEVKRGIIEKTPEPAGAEAANVKKGFAGYGVVSWGLVTYRRQWPCAKMWLTKCDESL
jgi:hypothetical protein